MRPFPYIEQIPNVSELGREICRANTPEEIIELLGLNMNAKRSYAVTPHAADPLPEGVADYLFVGTGGTVVFRSPNQDTDSTWTVPSGGYLTANVSHVRATSTASGIVACYTSEEE